MKVDLSQALVAIQLMAIGFLRQLPYLVIAAIVFAAFFFASRGVRDIIVNLSRRHRKHHSVGLVLGRLAQGGLILLGLLVGATIAVPSFKPAELIQILGIGGVAVGFAFKDIFQNFLAGILILLTEPFRIGDQIIIDKYEGTVEDIQTRATFIRTYDGRRVVIPNADLFNQSVTVNTAFDKRRDQYDIGIGYGDDVENARALILDTLKSIDIVLNDPPPQVLVVDLAGSSVNLRARWWVAPPMRSDVMASRNAVLTALKAKLTEQGVDLPYPTQQILFHDQTEEGDGDRSKQREGWPARNGRGTKPRALALAERETKNPVGAKFASEAADKA
jgi:small conductance mechanosensitive channel